MRAATYHRRVAEGLDQAIAKSRATDDPEAALRCFTKAAMDLLGDPEAHLQPGALRAGERHFAIGAAFIVAPGRQHMILFGDFGFPPEQRHLRIGIHDSRPGHTVTTGQSAVVPNTDDDGLFRMILSSARMGSAMYSPMFWQGEVIGMFNTAAQARNTYDADDLQLQRLFAAAATAAWCERGGAALVAQADGADSPWSRPA